MIGTLRHSKSHRDKIDASRKDREIVRRICFERGLPFPPRPHGTVPGDYCPLVLPAPEIGFNDIISSFGGNP